MKKLGTVLGAMSVVFAFVAPAQADIVFSGAGSSGTLASASETWTFNADGGVLLNNWGSPGVGSGTVAYGQAVPAFGMTLDFTGGGTIDADSISIGNNANCAGSTNGGTTFCTISPTDIWIATLTGPSSIKFTAQDPSFFLSPGQNYFVNVFFDGETPTAFTGSWLTSFSPVGVPEPATLALFGAGLAGLAFRRRRKMN